MWIFTSIADWFDTKNKETHNALDNWVENSKGSQGVIIAASTVHAFTTFGAGFVDILRLGDGVKQGTMQGVGNDALRIVAIFPFGKASSLLKQARGLTTAGKVAAMERVAAAKLIADPGGPNCFWVASAKALQQLAVKNKRGSLFLSVDDMLKALKISNEFPKIQLLSQGLNYFKRLGVRTGTPRILASEADIIAMLPRDGSVVLIGLKFIRADGSSGKHIIYAFRHPSKGTLAYMDRTINTTSPVRLYYSRLAELEPVYGAVKTELLEGAVLHSVNVKHIDNTMRMVIPVLGVIAEERND